MLSLVLRRAVVIYRLLRDRIDDRRAAGWDTRKSIGCARDGARSTPWNGLRIEL